METITYTLPAHWNCALYYGDMTGIDSDEECEVIDQIVDEMGEGFSYITIDPNTDESPEFVKYHDAHYHGILACDCITYTVTKFP